MSTSILNTFIEITIIKNKATSANGTGDSIISPVFKTYTIKSSSYNGSTNITSVTGGSDRSLEDFQREYEAGRDAVFKLRFANNIEIEHNYKDLTKRCKITLPRALNTEFKGSYMINFDNSTSPVPMFGRGDRIVVRTGYNGQLNTVFLGYITKVGIGTPLQLECEDMMFFLKTCAFRFSATELVDNSGISRANLISNNQITINDLFKCALLKQYNGFLTNNPSFALTKGANGEVFSFPGQTYPAATYKTLVNGSYVGAAVPPDAYGANIQKGIIAVYFDNGIYSNPITYSTKQDLNIAEFIADIKKKYPNIVVYFDDFINLRIGLEYTNDANTFVNINPVEFLFEGQIIDESNMKFQKADETNVQIIMKSPRSNKKLPPLIASDTNNPKKGYYGSSIGTIINFTAGVNLSQDDLNALAKIKYNAEKYDGWEKGSSFLTFGTPLVHIGNKIKLTSTLYPEKNGVYMCVGVTTTMGVGGYRQKISVGPKIK